MTPIAAVKFIPDAPLSYNLKNIAIHDVKIK
jgi:hypothetical protein